ncbi:MAG: hypothetical protein M3446_00790 [Actinomycetota bacterium]|nr:hypothetical protein [Geodermatophilaceae bacterium]MDQ3504230.1 hypothetical protein [Actinomycetota bacterium]
MAQRRPNPGKPSAPPPSDRRQRWSAERDAHLRQANAFSVWFPSRTRRSTTKLPAALRYAQHLPASRTVRGLLLLGAPGYAALQLSQGAAVGRAIGFAALLAVVILAASTYRLTVTNHGISFDIAGLRQASSFAFVPLYAVRDVRVGRHPEEWPKTSLKGGWWPGRRRANILHVDQAGATQAFYVWVSNPEPFGTALLGRPMTD